MLTAKVNQIHQMQQELKAAVYPVCNGCGMKGVAPNSCDLPRRCHGFTPKGQCEKYLVNAHGNAYQCGVNHTVKLFYPF